MKKENSLILYVIAEKIDAVKVFRRCLYSLLRGDCGVIMWYAGNDDVSKGVCSNHFSIISIYSSLSMDRRKSDTDINQCQSRVQSDFNLSQSSSVRLAQVNAALMPSCPDPFSS